MKLLIINGSPKLGKNNTSILLDEFIKGYTQNPENSVELIRMNNMETYQKASAHFIKEEHILLAFPLYSSSMPSGVKVFIENLESQLGKCQGKKIAFLVQYGFIEAIHARPLEKYLIHLCQLLGCEYKGTIIKGGCDGLSQNKASVKKILKGIYSIGKTFGARGEFSQKELDDFSAPEVQKKIPTPMAKLIIWFLNKFYWEKSLKKNGISLKESFARPYIAMSSMKIL